MPPEFAALLQAITVGALPLIFAITFHEAAHGYVAYKLGDDTAWKAGRVTFNPLRHIDLFGTIILPLVLFLGSSGRFSFGYAKPVPVRFDRLNRLRRDMVLVAAAGPATNLLLAIVSVMLLGGVAAMHLPGFFQTWTEANLFNSLRFNLILGVFNMIPLPPLDGGRVAVGLLPEALAAPLARSERYGILILITLIFLLPVIGDKINMNLDIFGSIVSWPVDWLIRNMLRLMGLSA
jgi:Zn-dependent protease